MTDLPIGETFPAPLKAPMGLRTPQPDLTLGSMTIGIGAICERGRAVVVAADRLVSFANPENMEFEADLKNATRLTNRCFVLFSANDISEAILIRDGVKADKSISALPISQIAERVREARETARAKIIEGLYLRRPLGMTMAEFKTAASTGSSQILTDVYNKTNAYRLFVSFLIVGIDDSGAHVFQVGESPTVGISSNIGYSTIGIGYLHALVSLARRGHKKSTSISQAIYNVYEAKRAAELAPGVGKETDIGIIQVGKKARFLSDKKIRKLGQIYDKNKPEALSTRDLDSIRGMVDR